MVSSNSIRSLLSLDMYGCVAECVPISILSDAARVLSTSRYLEALPSIIDGLRAKGFTFKTVGELIYRDNYTMQTFKRPSE